MPCTVFERTTQAITPAPMSLEAALGTNRDLFVINCGWTLELIHNGGATYNAVYTRTRNMVLMFDVQLIEKVAELLPPRLVRIHTANFYMSRKLGEAYPQGVGDTSSVMPITFLSPQNFAVYDTSVRKPFEWDPGIKTPKIPQKEYRALVRTAMLEVQRNR